VGIGGETTVWPPDMEPLPPKHQLGKGRPPSRLRRSSSQQPAAVLDLVKHAPEDLWQDVCWREGTRGKMTSRFIFLRVRPAHRDERRHEPRDIEWLIAEWPKSETEPTKFWLSTMSADTSPEQLVRLAKLRWRIERDYQELKGSFGLDHYEGRGWRGFHHHGVLCIAAYAFLAAERARLSPLSLSPSSVPLVYPAVSNRGALPVRPERHVPTSIETLFRIQARALLQNRCCSWCGRAP
jgi:SRSO17 transposase